MDNEEMQGEANVTGSVGSNEEVEFLSEVLTRSRSARETGYIGQNSEVQWLRSVQKQAEGVNTQVDPLGEQRGPPGKGTAAADLRADALHQRRRYGKQSSMHHMTDTSFYLDSENIEVDIAVDPHEIPDPVVAEELFNCYLETVHTSFPLMPASFEDQFRRYISSVKDGRPFSVPDKWRAIMNLVLAIGARFSHLMGHKWVGDPSDHLVYMVRAVNLLDLKGTGLILPGPDLNSVETVSCWLSL